MTFADNEGTMLSMYLLRGQCYINLSVDFKTWKTCFEEEISSSFVKPTGNKRDSDDNLICYYYCNRTGFYNTKKTGEWSMTRRTIYCIAIQNIISKTVKHRVLLD